jgi:hypothetical protein
MMISVELPNKKKYLELHKMVTKHMMHGPCGTLNPSCYARQGMSHARTITHAHFMRHHHRERIHTPSTGDAMMLAC